MMSFLPANIKDDTLRPNPSSGRYYSLMKWLGWPVVLLLLQEPPGWKRLEEALRPPAQKEIAITSWPDLRPLDELSGTDAFGNSPMCFSLLHSFLPESTS